MDTLDDTEWDVVISGTGLAQSLLALSLSRSDKKVLHVDRNDYYGGNEAALSLSEACVWAEKYAAHSPSSSPAAFSHATIEEKSGGDADDDDRPKLSFSRAYSLALAPQLVFAQSILLPALVSSRVHSQLEFQAVGSWFVVEPEETSQPKLVKVPNGREDIFQDTRLDLRAKRSLMKFIRFMGNPEEQLETWQDEKYTPFQTLLEQKFGLPPASHASIMALALSPLAPEKTTVDVALPNIARHLHSIGLFGPGFGAVLPKWGGLAELSQVACRAGAVGGGVYVLKKGVSSVERLDDGPIALKLSEGEKVTTQFFVASPEDLDAKAELEASSARSKSITIVSSALSRLFPPTSEGGVTPAGAVVVMPSGSSDEPPVYIFAHASDSGECPAGQCVLYASVALPHDQGFQRLKAAIRDFLLTMPADDKVDVLWSLHYEQHEMSPAPIDADSNIITTEGTTSDLAFEDQVLEKVCSAWQKITGEDRAGFMRFEARAGAEEEEIFG